MVVEGSAVYRQDILSPEANGGGMGWQDILASLKNTNQREFISALYGEEGENLGCLVDLSSLGSLSNQASYFVRDINQALDNCDVERSKPRVYRIDRYSQCVLSFALEGEVIFSEDYELLEELLAVEGGQKYSDYRDYFEDLLSGEVKENFVIKMRMRKRTKELFWMILRGENIAGGDLSVLREVLREVSQLNKDGVNLAVKRQNDLYVFKEKA